MSQLIYDMNLIDSNNSHLEKLDFLILGCGSDYRAYEILKKYNQSLIKPQNILLLNFTERIDGCKPDDNIFSYKSLSTLSISPIECSIKFASSSLEKLLQQGFTSDSKIGIDISVLTKPYIFFLLRLLTERIGIETITIYYTEPQSYVFPQGLFNAFHTSNGPLEILEIPGFTGREQRDSQRTLVIFLGFDGDISKEINEDISPLETIIVNGFPSYSPKFKDISLIANEKLVSDHNIKVRYSKANNPFETYNLLNTIKQEKKADTIFMNIAPLGTKPMALGACLFALHNPDVRVVYPLPETYEKMYTDKSWTSWKYLLPLII